jgi:Replication protein
MSRKDASVPMGNAGTPASSSSSVHPHEISESDSVPPCVLDEAQHPCDLYMRPMYHVFRHSGWKQLRRSTYDAMADAGIKPRTLDRFASCGTQTRIYQHAETQDLTLMGNFCRSRFCSPCSTARSRLLQSNLIRFIKHKCVRFLTLTLKHNGDESLSFLIDRFWKSFKLLRKQPQWDRHVTGFAMFVETKWSARDSGWHVHGHCLCEGFYWDQKAISHHWHACTGDSYIVDIQRKGTPEQMAYYGAKYVSKPLNAADVGTHARLVEAIKAVHGRHLFLIGGRWKGNLELDQREPLDANWTDVGDANALWSDADNGCETARLLIEVLTHHKLTPNIALAEIPPPRNG